MEKSSKIINLLTILVGLAVAVLAYLLLTGIDQIRRDSSAKQAEVTAAKKVFDENNASQKAGLQLLRAKKSGLNDDLELHRERTNELRTSLPAKEIELAGLKKQQDEARLQAENNKVQATNLQTEVTGVNGEINRLRLGNPAASAALEQARNDIQDQNDLTSELQFELRDYKAETAHLRAHYASIIEALEADADNPAWITIGKSVSTRIERLSMEAGMLVFPLGTTHGMRDDMRFFVSKKGKRVGQVVIKDAGLAHSVANIVPLTGTPTKLRELDTVEITGF